MMLNERCEFGEGKITRQQLNSLERALDQLFASLGIEVEFTKHFFDRVNHERNKRQITLCELSQLFSNLYKKFGLHLQQIGDTKEVDEVVKSVSTNINIPFHIKWNPRKREIELIAKTIMRKKDFKTRTKVLRVESYKQFMKRQG